MHQVGAFPCISHPSLVNGANDSFPVDDLRIVITSADPICHNTHIPLTRESRICREEEPSFAAPAHNRPICVRAATLVEPPQRHARSAFRVPLPSLWHSGAVTGSGDD